MLEAINKQYNNEKKNASEERFIAESVLEVEDIVPGSEEEMDDVVDVDSVPDDVYTKVDQALDKLISDKDYDDVEADELLDDDMDEDEVSDADLEAIMDEAVGEIHDGIPMNEVNTGAIESIQHVFKGYSKEAKEHMQNAKRLQSQDKPKEAKDEINKAIEILKKGRKEAEQIDDDGILEHIVISMIMGVFGPLGALAYNIGFFISWYNLQSQSAKGDTYSNRHPDRDRNLILEGLFGKLRGAGWSRSNVLAGYDKLIKECENVRNRM